MAMLKYILQAPNCWYQFPGRVAGVPVSQRQRQPQFIIESEGGGGNSMRGVAPGTEGPAAALIMQGQGGEEELAEGGMI